MRSLLLVFLLAHLHGQTQVPEMTLEFHDGSVVFKDLTLFRPSGTGTGELVAAFGGTIENNSGRAFGPLVQVQIDCTVAVMVGKQQKVTMRVYTEKGF